MMQKRTLYISLLLVSCLLFFGFSYASAQSVGFQSKTASRCSDVTVNITVDNPGELSALEIVFEVTGDYSSMNVDFASGFTGLNNRILNVDGNVVRMAALKADAGDACVDATGGIVVGEITFTTSDVCSGAISMVGTTVQGGCCDAVTATTGLVGCDLAALATTVTPGTITIVNHAPSITCPDDQVVHWGDLVAVDVIGDDADLGTGCEALSYSVTSGPGSIDASGHYTWQTGGDDVCEHEVTVRVTDECGEFVECSFNICVQNTPPVVNNGSEAYYSVWGIALTGAVDATDPDSGPSALNYTLESFDGPTSFGGGLVVDPATGEWTWDIGIDPAYLGDFELCVKVSDGANVCDPCSPENSVIACYSIHVTGFIVQIEKIHDAMYGEYAEVPVHFTSADYIGGFDFLITYDASVLTAGAPTPGELIDDEFEYFTYRYGADGNCGNGCPSGMMRVIGLRETNDGVTNPNHVSGSGILFNLNFLVSSDLNYECSYVPVQFYWMDCGDNTISDEIGNWMHTGILVYDFEGNMISDGIHFNGIYGPDTSCYDTVYAYDEEEEEFVFKNAPIGSIVFYNGGVDIACVEDLDDRGDINLNGVVNEIADAVLFTNYFIYGTSVFTINEAGQTAATDVNADGKPLTVADLVYLIRVIVGDAQPYAKTVPGEYASVSLQGHEVNFDANTNIGAAALVFEGNVNLSLGEDAAGMELASNFDGQYTKAIIYSLNANTSFSSGQILEVEGEGTLISVEAANFYGGALKTDVSTLPTNFNLSQNYPNPFNPVTKINLELPVASNWSIEVFNINGQRVAQFSGASEAGIVTVEWNAENFGSGMYFYKAVAGDFSATKKMVLLK